MTTINSYKKNIGNKISIHQHKNELSQTEIELRRVVEEINSKVIKQNKKGAKIGTVIGIGFGIATALPTFGTSLVAAPTLGAVIGKWLGNKMKVNPTFQNEIVSRQKRIQQLRNSIEFATRTMEWLSQIKYKSLLAFKADKVYTIEDYQNMKNAEESGYEDVLQRLEETKMKALKVPGFRKAYLEFTGKDLDQTRAIKEVISDLKSSVAQDQELALKRLYPLEEESNIIHYSKEIYKNYLHNRNHQVKVIVLTMMSKASEIRCNEKEFINTVERFLESNIDPLVDAALFAIANTNYKSSNINYQLRKMAIIDSNQSSELQRKAYNILKIRHDQGHIHALNVELACQHILETTVGNNHLKKQLKNILLEYCGVLQDKSIRGPAILFYLFGPPGTGKTTLISRLQEEINQDQYGLIRITMPEIRTLDDLIIQLQNASPLQGKTIFFDEFQALDNIKPVEEQNKVIEFLKLIFENNYLYQSVLSKELNLKIKTNDGNNHIALNNGGFNLGFHNTIVAIATNIEISQMPCLNQTDNGKNLRCKIYEICKQIRMTSNLRDFIPEFVSKFSQYALFRFAKKTHIGDNINITTRCEPILIEDLRHRTSHLKEVTGRDLTFKMIHIINEAIAEFEELNKFIFQRDEEGKIIQPLSLDINDHGEYTIQCR